MELAALESFMSIRQLVEMSIGTDWETWWADPAFGSKLWILRSSGKTGPSLASDVRQAILDSTAWLKDDGLVSSIEVDAESIGKYRVDYTVKVPRPDGSTDLIKDVWDGI